MSFDFDEKRLMKSASVMLNQIQQESVRCRGIMIGKMRANVTELIFYMSSDLFGLSGLQYQEAMGCMDMLLRQIEKMEGEI